MPKNPPPVSFGWEAVPFASADGIEVPEAFPFDCVGAVTPNPRKGGADPELDWYGKGLKRLFEAGCDGCCDGALFTEPNKLTAGVVDPLETLVPPATNAVFPALSVNNPLGAAGTSCGRVLLPDPNRPRGAGVDCFDASCVAEPNRPTGVRVACCDVP